VEKISKRDLKRPDAVTQTLGKATKWVAENRKAVQAVVLAFFILCVAYVAYAVLSERKEDKAQTALFKAEDSFNKLDAEYKKVETPPKPEGKKKSGDLMTDYKEPVELYRAVINEYPGTGAAASAAIQLGRLYYDYKKYDEQVGLLETVAPKTKSPVLKALALNLLGVGYDAKGDCGKAAEVWEKIESDKKMRFLAADSALKAGACYEKMGQADKAKASYERVVKDYAELDPQSVAQAKKFLRTLNKG